MDKDRTSSLQMDDIEKRYQTMKQEFSERNITDKLSREIDRWEKDSIAMIKLEASKAQYEAQRLTSSLNDQVTVTLDKLSTNLRKIQTARSFTQNDIEQLNTLLESCRNELTILNEINVVKFDLSSIDLIKIGGISVPKKIIPVSPSQIENSSDNRFRTNVSLVLSPPNNDRNKMIYGVSNHMSVPSRIEPLSYPNLIFGFDSLSNSRIQQLFKHLQSLPPMNTNESMNDDCDHEATQMEEFLEKNFDFKNSAKKNIFYGVQSFKLGKSLSSINRKKVINFPNQISSQSFVMGVDEILEWQESYAVYVDKSVRGINKEFLKRALQGRSESGEEAFAMKFIVRISTCPILMEFDARVIPRALDEDWPHRIKLVSVSRVDFSGQKHDLNDITTYLSNWKDIYEIDSESGYPVIYDGKDFHQKIKGPRAQLRKDRLLNDLIQMTRLRLRACDEEKVQIVVETVNGFGVSAGQSIGIDDQVRTLSASAIQKVLEEDGTSFQHITAIVFALPTFEEQYTNSQIQSIYQAFADVFHKSNYQGPIPVFIADQDMHRLTVAIARSGWIVSELNFSDSHGVFGAYWQNRGPALEEKLALTTLGLLVQHHIINPYVLDSSHYNFIST